MKIGITCYPTYGGSGVLASELGRMLAIRGHEIHFVTSKVPYKLTMAFQERIFFHETEVEHTPPFEYPPYDLVLAARMREVFKSEKLDLFHVHYAIPHAISAFLAAEMLKPEIMPIVTTLHGTDITLVGKKEEFFDLTRLAINRSSMVTAVSDYLKRETEKVFQPETPINRIHNFADLELFKRITTNCHRDMLAQPNQPIYVHVSNFRKVKRVLDVVQIFHRVRQEVDGVLLMMGEGPMLRNAKKLSTELGLGSSVKFLGMQEDVASLLGCADVLIFPSEVESFGLAALEAMACEIPVIASTSGGIPEVVANGETGFLSEIGDVESMAKNAIILGKDAELRKKMGLAGRKRAERLFRPDVIVPQYEALYEKCLRENGH